MVRIKIYPLSEFRTSLVGIFFPSKPLFKPSPFCYKKLRQNKRRDPGLPRRHFLTTGSALAPKEFSPQGNFSAESIEMRFKLRTESD